MAHRELLTESPRVSFHVPATDERGMVRHYTLTAEDLALGYRRRSDPNRLGFAVMLCYPRFPGRILQQGERPSAALCAFVAEQLGLDAAHFGAYAERDQTRREHVLEIQAALGLRPLTRALYRELAAWLLPTALATDHGPTLVTALLEELRTRRIVCPPLPAIERLGGSVRATDTTKCRALNTVRGPLGLPLERDLYFVPTRTLSACAELARDHRRIIT
jgi:hypothetical protein